MKVKDKRFSFDDRLNCDIKSKLLDEYFSFLNRKDIVVFMTKKENINEHHYMYHVMYSEKED